MVNHSLRLFYSVYVLPQAKSREKWIERLRSIGSRFLVRLLGKLIACGTSFWSKTTLDHALLWGALFLGVFFVFLVRRLPRVRFLFRWSICRVHLGLLMACEFWSVEVQLRCRFLGSIHGSRRRLLQVSYPPSLLQLSSLCPRLLPVCSQGSLWWRMTPTHVCIFWVKRPGWLLFPQFSVGVWFLEVSWPVNPSPFFRNICPVF